MNHTTGKKIVLLTGLRLPNITDRSETLLFDWEDFEVAGGLDKLAETIITRQHFEPVEFFGGKEVFHKTVERDKRKADLAKRHGVKLLIVTETDNHDDIVRDINNILNKRKVLPR